LPFWIGTARASNLLNLLFLKAESTELFPTNPLSVITNSSTNIAIGTKTGEGFNAATTAFHVKALISLTSTTPPCDSVA